MKFKDKIAQESAVIHAKVDQGEYINGYIQGFEEALAISAKVLAIYSINIVKHLNNVDEEDMPEDTE